VSKGGQEREGGKALIVVIVRFAQALADLRSHVNPELRGGILGGGGTRAGGLDLGFERGDLLFGGTADAGSLGHGFSSVVGGTDCPSLVTLLNHKP